MLVMASGVSVLHVTLQSLWRRPAMPGPTDVTTRKILPNATSGRYYLYTVSGYGRKGKRKLGANAMKRVAAGVRKV